MRRHSESTSNFHKYLEAGNLTMTSDDPSIFKLEEHKRKVQFYEKFFTIFRR